MLIKKIDSTTSTNSFASELANEIDGDFAVMAREQTAGRGQRGNSWESAPGKNVTLSILLRPNGGIIPTEQFVLSQCASIGVVETVRHYIGDEFGKVAIKWPNDIYVGERKICGILIENSISNGMIRRTIMGIGLNVNQQRFESDAPNPVSMFQLTGTEVNVDEVARLMCEKIERNCEKYLKPEMYDELRERYFSMLWRHLGFYPYIETSSGEQFEGEIIKIAPSGHITLMDTNGVSRCYAFKEVKATGLSPCPKQAL